VGNASGGKVGRKKKRTRLTASWEGAANSKNVQLEEEKEEGDSTAPSDCGPKRIRTTQTPFQEKKPEKKKYQRKGTRVYEKRDNLLEKYRKKERNPT